MQGCRRLFFLVSLLTLTLGFSSCSNPAPQASATTPAPAYTKPIRPTSVARPVAPATVPVKLGIDVLASRNFAPLAGKRVGLLSHPAGVNSRGVPTVEVLRGASNLRLVALFGPEHGIYGTVKAGENIADTKDPKTGLPAYSLYGKNRKPTRQQLAGIDALVIDLQDIGSRSYTFAITMRYAMEACFENGVHVVVLDRPNPLGGLKVDGPILDRALFSGVGGYAIPYVHGLTIGEIARMAAATPGMLEVSESVRAKGKLTVVPMSGWRRSMRWPETGLTFTPTSPMIQDFAACVGYAMIGLGCEIGGFTHGVGNQYPFRGIWFKDRPVDKVQKELEALRLPGVAFRRVTVPKANGQPAMGVYVEVTDWEDWRPTDLSFHMMVLACKFNARNPFAAANATLARKFNIHTGSQEWFDAIKRDGAKVDLDAFIRKWRIDAAAFQQNSRKFWLYN